MKKLITLAGFVVIAAIVACGPSAAEKEKAIKEADSIAKTLTESLNKALSDTTKKEATAAVETNKEEKKEEAKK